MGCIEVKGVRIGEGQPKIQISLMGVHIAQCLETAVKGQLAGVDVFEYRADFSHDIHNVPKMVEHCQDLARALPASPVLFTVRTTDQGGQVELAASEYEALLKAVIADGSVDMIDIEFGYGDELVQELCATARAAGIVSVVSYHDFEGTPTVEELLEVMDQMVEQGADIPKVAVMAHGPEDALVLLSATEEMHRMHDGLPLQTMAMGRDGSITRLTGELFGSALTFCSLDEESAPGQVDVATARRIMNDLHTIMS